MSRDIDRTLRLFHQPGSVVEIRILGMPERELVSHAVRYFVDFRKRNSSREFWELSRRGSGMGLEEPERFVGRLAIGRKRIPAIVDALRDRGWSPISSVSGEVADA